MRICRAAFAAATSADAPGAAGSVTTTRVYRFCTVLIASDMATCTMAKVRSLGLLPTSLATRALAVTFQSVTTSAPAGATHSAAATMPVSRTATRVFGIALMAGLLVWVRAAQPEFATWTDFRPRDGVHRADRPVGQLVYPFPTGLTAVLERSPRPARRRTARVTHLTVPWTDTAAAWLPRPSALCKGVQLHVGCHASRSLRPRISRQSPDHERDPFVGPAPSPAD